MSLSAAAVALGVASSVVAAAPTQTAKKKSDPPSSSKKAAAPKISKWQQHVLETLKNAAPGDEYFGRMKMSYLGINNTFHDNAIRAGAYTTDSHLVSAVMFADDALNAWSRKYPNDPQLARSYFLAFQMYRKVWTQDGQQKAWNYANIVIRKWPSSFFGKALKKDLSIGFTEHFFATPVPCESLIVAASPGRSATPSASPSPTPSPTPTPTPAPGQPKIDILPVPCSTPTPSPTPVPTPTPLPSGSLTPSPLPSSSGSPAPAPSASSSARPTATPTTMATATPTHRP